MPRPLETGLRFSLASIALLALAHVFGQALLAALLPIFRWALGLLDDHYRILALSLTTQGADNVLRLDVTLARPVFVGGQVILPDPRGIASVTTLAGNVLQPVILLLAALASWPVRGKLESLARAAGGTVALAALLLVDLPFVLLAEIWALFIDAHAPGRFSPLLAWSAFLQSGGRLALAMALAAGVIAITQRGNHAPNGLSGKARQPLGMS